MRDLKSTVSFGGGGTRSDAPVRSAPEPFLGHSHSTLITLPPLSCGYYEFLPDA